MDRPAAGGFLSLTAFQAEGCGIAYGAAERPGFRRFRGFGLPLAGWFRGWRIALSGNAYKVSVTGLAFYVIWYDRHSADWLAALASPYPAAPDFPLFRGQNKALKSSPFISSSQHNGAL